jgi:transposase
VIVTDRYGGYAWLAQERNQVCRAHLLRDWKALAGRAGPLGTYGSRLVELEKQLHREWNQWRSGELSREAFVERAAQVRVKMDRICEEAGKIKGSPGVLRRMTDEAHRERGWVFVEHEDVELTNNQSERDVRTCVIQRKLSHGSQSQEGLELMERLWTVGLTCQRQGTSVLDFITQALQAHRLGHAPTPLV